PLTMHFGPENVLLALDVEFKDELTSDEIEESIRRLEQDIRERHGIVKRIFIEAKAIANRRSPKQ
ncbi:MAG: cation transporter, partial [Bacteroidota bacterium]